MRRLGYLARHAFTTHSGVLDAQQYTAALPVCARGAELCITSRRYLRRMCCTFLILMRTLHVARESVLAADLPPDQAESIKACFHEHHVECSVDGFATVQQMVQLAPGMRLVYRMDFNGMYNDVSQVSTAHSLAHSLARAYASAYASALLGETDASCGYRSSFFTTPSSSGSRRRHCCRRCAVLCTRCRLRSSCCPS